MLQQQTILFFKFFLFNAPFIIKIVSPVIQLFLTHALMIRFLGFDLSEHL